MIRVSGALIAAEGKDPDASRVFFLIPNHERGGYALSLTVRGTLDEIIQAIDMAESRQAAG